MNLEQRVNDLLPAFQARLRAFAFGPELDQSAAQMLKLLESQRRRRADTTDRLRLKALALMAEYLDAHGRSQEAASLLKLTVAELLDGGMGGDPKLMRQQVWCCLAYALTHLRANRTREAGKIIIQMRLYAATKLVSPEFPCHGTLALLRYYEGLWHRNTGDLNSAARDFDEALEQARLRYDEKKQKYEKLDPDRLRRELVYSRVMTARILGFGHGGIALARGRYIEARGWMTSASLILSSLGQETWRRGLEVYARSSAVMLAEWQTSSLSENAARLRELEAWFTPRNSRNAFIAGAFAILAELRIRQIESGSVLKMDLKGLRNRLDACLRTAYRDSGPLSATATLYLIECLLRAEDFTRCQKELDRFEKAFEGEEEVMAEFRVLQAELWLRTGRQSAARATLQALVQQMVAHRGYRARAWALLAWSEKEAGQSIWADRAIHAATQALDAVQDGSARAMVKEIATIVNTTVELKLAMPYQGDASSWCNLDHNLEMAKLNVVATVHARYPSYNVDQLAAAMGRGVSWLYALLGKHRDLDWVAQILSPTRST